MFMAFHAGIQFFIDLFSMGVIFNLVAEVFMSLKTVCHDLTTTSSRISITSQFFRHC